LSLTKNNLILICNRAPQRNLFSALRLPLIKGGLTRKQPRLMTAPLAEFKRVRALAHVAGRKIWRQVRDIKL
jgi:hypothetical protein